MKGGNRLELGEPVKRLKAFFAAMTGFADTAKGQFDAATGTVMPQSC